MSTEDQADEGLGITAQIDVATAAIAERDWVLVAEVVDAGVSGSVAPERRPALGPALEALDGAGAGAALVVARLDRVTRSLLAWAELVERSRRRGWAIVVVAEGFDLSTDSGELTAALLASVAQYERRLIGARTREAMAAARRGAPGTAARSSTPPRRATSWGTCAPAPPPCRRSPTGSPPRGSRSRGAARGAPATSTGSSGASV